MGLLSSKLLLPPLLISIVLFFLLSNPNPNPNSRRLLLAGGGGGDLVDYLSLHHRLAGGRRHLSLPVISLLVLLLFYSLIITAGDHFTPVVTRLSSSLRLSPSMAAVTLLALGNGAPDLFSSSAALRRGEPRTGLAAILSAGAFVSAFVVGSVSIIAAPFPLDPAPFIRDVFCYLVAVLGLFYVYLSGEMYLWQGVGFVGLYVFFVGLVFWMDFGSRDSCKRREEEVEEVEMGLVEKSAAADVEGGDGGEVVGDRWSLFWMMGKISRLWEVPVTIILKLTIPSVSPSEYSRFYTSANICLCPLLILYSLSSFVPIDTQIVFILPHSQFPLWTVVLFISFSLGVAHFFFENEPQQKDSENKNTATTLVAFVMSVFWISTMAGELLNCLAAVGTILDLPPAILGLTVLAWGNSVGDLVADVALAKAGQPAMAMAGCFVGPMFNMLIGLGSAMVIETAKAYPGAYELRFHVGIVVAFVFLLFSLMGSLLVVTWFRFRVPRFWGFCLVGLYVLFTAVSLAIARFAG